MGSAAVPEEPSVADSTAAAAAAAAPIAGPMSPRQVPVADPDILPLGSAVPVLFCEHLAGRSAGPRGTAGQELGLHSPGTSGRCRPPWTARRTASE